MSVYLDTGKPTQRCRSLPFPAQLPALPLIPARKHPDTRPEHPESYCLSEIAAGIQGWVAWSPFPLYTAVIPPLKQKGTWRGEYSSILVKPSGNVHLVSQQTHQYEFRHLD